MTVNSQQLRETWGKPDSKMKINDIDIYSTVNFQNRFCRSILFEFCKFSKFEFGGDDWTSFIFNFMEV